MNLVTINALGVALPPHAIEGVRFNVKEVTSYVISEDRVANPLMSLKKTINITATLRFPGALQSFILPFMEGDKEAGEEEASEVVETELTIISQESDASQTVSFFQSEQYQQILSILENDVVTFEEEYNTASKKDKEAKLALLEKAKKSLALAQKAPVSMMNNLTTIETANQQKSQLAPIKTSFVGLNMTPADEEEETVSNPMEAQINALNQQVDKATRLFDNKIVFFNSYLDKNTTSTLDSIEGSVDVNGKNYTVKDLLKLVFS